MNFQTTGYQNTKRRTGCGKLLAAIAALGLLGAGAPGVDTLEEGQWVRQVATEPTTQAADSGVPSSRPTSRPTSRRSWFSSRVVREETKRADTLIKALAPIAAGARESVGQVVGDGKEIALATVVREDGYLVTKASEIENASVLTVTVGSSGVALPATVVAVVRAHDLALLQIKANALKPVDWVEMGTVKVGEIVVGVGNGKDALGMGVISVGRRPTQGGMLGVMLQDTDDGVVVGSLSPGAPAEKAGVKPQDVILMINDQEFEDRDSLREFLQSQSAGTEVAVTVKRGDEKLVFRITLAQLDTSSSTQPSRARTQNTMGGPLSRRASNFPAVYQHDVILKPEQQGGPLVDLDGKTVGINIARSGRVETLAIPADVVAGLIGDMVAGKYPPPPPPPAAATTQPTTQATTQPATQP